MNTPTRDASSPGSRPSGTAADYVALARPDHWVKHVFIIPGIVLAWVLHGGGSAGFGWRVILGLASAACIASANYVLNEWLDAEQDAHHPTKARRPAVAKELSPVVIWAEYLGLCILGLAFAWEVSVLFLVTSGVFLASGLVYNVRPIRTKDRAYLDVVSESLNNPIRLTLGWAMVDSTTLPPSSLLFAYWMGGAFLMALKRFAEYRTAAAAGDVGSLERYRRSFRRYTENSLLLSAFLYALMAAFFLAVFLVKYRIEYLLSLPLFAALFVTYLRVALAEDSSVQTPEKLFQERALMLVSACLVVALLLLTWIDLPVLDRLTSPHYITLGLP